jgi:hypothetical protein
LFGLNIALGSFGLPKIPGRVFLARVATRRRKTFILPGLSPVGFFRKYFDGARSLSALETAQRLCFVRPGAKLGSFLRVASRRRRTLAFILEVRVAGKQTLLQVSS